METKDTNGPISIAPDALLQRIDTMMRELQELRRIVSTQTITPNAQLVDQLWGAFAPASASDNDPYLEWERFTP